MEEALQLKWREISGTAHLDCTIHHFLSLFSLSSPLFIPSNLQFSVGQTASVANFPTSQTHEINVKIKPNIHSNLPFQLHILLCTEDEGGKLEFLFNTSKFRTGFSLLSSLSLQCSGISDDLVKTLRIMVLGVAVDFEGS